MTDDDCIDALWIEPAAAGGWSFAALTEASGLAPGELRELIDYGALQPENPGVESPERWLFDTHCVVAVRAAGRLRRDFDLDAPGLALALTLIGRIRDLEDELRRMNAVMPR